MFSIKPFGKNPSGERLDRIRKSPNYKNDAFSNLSATSMMAEDTSMWRNMKDFFNKPKNNIPSQPIPTIKTDLKSLAPDFPSVVWFGHSSYLIRLNGKNILIDPVFSNNASPVSFMIPAFEGANAYTANDMPEIDLLILTHDHYDHLDYKTIMALNPKVKQIFCSLGVGSHLEYWGIDTGMITEFDWWDTHAFTNDIHFTATPARHFTGRGLKRAKTLWSSFVLKSPNYSLFIGGDSGYGEHFKTIGEKFGPFDLVMLESGQYNKAWPYIHMMPEQTVQAAHDLKAHTLFPVHWGKFALAMHDWNEPIKRVLKKAAELSMPVTTPLIGEPVLVNAHYPNKTWWEF